MNVHDMWPCMETGKYQMNGRRQLLCLSIKGKDCKDEHNYYRDKFA